MVCYTSALKIPKQKSGRWQRRHGALPSKIRSISLILNFQRNLAFDTHPPISLYDTALLQGWIHLAFWWANWLSRLGCIQAQAIMALTSSYVPNGLLFTFAIKSVFGIGLPRVPIVPPPHPDPFFAHHPSTVDPLPAFSSDITYLSESSFN